MSRIGPNQKNTLAFMADKVDHEHHLVIRVSGYNGSSGYLQSPVGVVHYRRKPGFDVDINLHHSDGEYQFGRPLSCVNNKGSAIERAKVFARHLIAEHGVSRDKIKVRAKR